jgi:hypothetical protein
VQLRSFALSLVASPLEPRPLLAGGARTFQGVDLLPSVWRLGLQINALAALLSPTEPASVVIRGLGASPLLPVPYVSFQLLC